MNISDSDHWSVLSGTSRQPLVKPLFNLWIQYGHYVVFDLNTPFKIFAIFGSKCPPAKTSISLLRKLLSKFSPQANLIWNKIPSLYISKEKRVSSNCICATSLLHLRHATVSLGSCTIVVVMLTFISYVTKAKLFRDRLLRKLLQKFITLICWPF